MKGNNIVLDNSEQSRNISMIEKFPNELFILFHVCFSVQTRLPFLQSSQWAITTYEGVVTRVKNGKDMGKYYRSVGINIVEFSIFL